MKTLAAIMLSVALMTSNLFAQNTIQPILDISPKMKEKIEAKLQEKNQKDSLKIPLKLQGLQLQGQSNEQNTDTKVIIDEAQREKIKNLLEERNKKKQKKFFEPLVLPLVPDTKEIEKEEKNSEKKNGNDLMGEMTTLPSNIRMPGEFEEVQAVIVSIPNSMYGVIGTNPLQVVPLDNSVTFSAWRDLLAIELGFPVPTTKFHIPPGQGVFWSMLYKPISQITQADFDIDSLILFPKELVLWNPDFLLGIYNSAGQLVGIDSTTIVSIWGKLISAIQDEGCEAWIRLTGYDTWDSISTEIVKDYLADNGYPLIEGKYKFFSDGTEDAYWVRDWGPLGIYYDDAGSNRKLGFLDAKYYTGRAFDDEFPKTILNAQGYDYYNLDVKMEGGNIMNDGYKYGSYGDRIYANNNSTGAGSYGQYKWNEANQSWNLEFRTPINEATLDTRMKTSFGFEDVIVPQSLQFDGRTGHIDLWIKQFDEETMLIADMPDKYSVLTDYEIIQQNREKYQSLKTAFGTNYRFLNAPMPRLDGGDMPTVDTLYTQDPRGYLNGITVNKSYIYPSFSTTPSDPCWRTDSTANEILKKLLPGYKLVPIDSRHLTPLGGAIHCITMQIPQEPSRVITIRHKPIRDAKYLAPSFDISAELISNTDANRVVAYWKKINDAQWQTIEMTSTDGRIYNGQMQFDDSFVWGDTIRYYIAAQNNNTIRKCAPITGPEGYYEFYFDERASVEELYGFEPKASIIASIYPNPATNGYLNVVFENIADGNVMIEVVNSLGQTMQTPVNKYFSKGVFLFDITDLNSLNKGVYFLKMTTNSGISVMNFVVQ